MFEYENCLEAILVAPKKILNSQENIVNYRYSKSKKPMGLDMNIQVCNNVAQTMFYFAVFVTCLVELDFHWQSFDSYPSVDVQLLQQIDSYVYF